MFAVAYRSNAGASFEPEPPPLVHAQLAREAVRKRLELLCSMNFCAKWDRSGQRHCTERPASYLVKSSLFLTLRPQRAGHSSCHCRFRGLLLELNLLLRAGLCVHKVGGIVHDVADKLLKSLGARILGMVVGEKRRV